MVVNLGAVERTWFAKRVTGQSATTPLNDLKRLYLVAQIGGPAADVNALNDLERQWVRSLIVANGATPQGDKLSDLWTQLVASAGFRASKFLRENRLTYFLNT